LQTSSVNTPRPAKGLRAGALVVGGGVNVGGALLVLLAMPGNAPDERIAAAWCLVQFLTGVWAGVLGANSPFLHGVVAGLPALALGWLIAGPLPVHFVAVAWALAPCAALIAAALMRLVRRR
jgi:hypothetical protein